jgi:outer membrane lipoprotein SlyB
MALLRHVLAFVLCALLTTMAGAVFAQPAPSAARIGDVPQIEAFDVERVARLAPGVALHFSLYGTPGGTAMLRIEGARRDLALREREPGVYEGSYVVDGQDRISPDSRVGAMLRRGEQVTAARLEERLVLDGPVPVAFGPPPSVDLPAGKDPPVNRGVPRTGGLDDASPTAPPASRARTCDDCAVVESIQAVDAGQGGGHFGLFAGGLLGAIFGEQVADRSERDLARIAGAIGGALAGRAIERSVRSRTQYDVLLRLPGGARLVRTYDRAPAFKVGDTISLGVNLGGARRERMARDSKRGPRPADRPPPVLAQP